LTALTVTYLPIELLVPYARNSRTHSDAQVAQIAASIREFGWSNPVLTDGDGGIIAGHGRVLAARQLGMQAVPCIRLGHLSPTQRKALILADNKLALNAGWDDELLSLELQDLASDGFDLELTGFSGDELADLLADRTEGLTDPDDAPDPPVNPVSVLGDVWVMGKHRVMCGDSTSLDAVETLMAGQRADLIVTDPPYGVNFERGKYVNRSKAAKGPKFEAIANDELKGDALTEFIRAALACGFAVAKDAPIYVWAPALTEGGAVLAGVKASGFHVQSQIVWRKTPFVIGRADYQWQHEICWYGFKGKNHPWYGGRNKATVWDCPKPQKMDLHPTMKPVALIAVAVENSSKGGDIVLDLFGGSGSTLIACEQTGRDARLMELAPNYCDVIVKRWQDFTGQTATLEATGQTFADVCEQRYADTGAAINSAGSYDDAVAGARKMIEAAE
jgi:DNA modification methylase